MGLRKSALGFALALSGAITGDVAAQSQRAGVVTVATGTVHVARPSAPDAPLKFRDDVFIHDRISTGEHSLARILLGGKAVVTVSERSAVTIIEMPRRTIIDLAAGRMSLAVARDKMMPGDSVEIRTSVAIAGVRGTVVVAEIVPGASPAATAARFTVLKGLVDVTGLDPTTRQALGAPTFLAARQTLLADRRGVAPPTAITRQAAERLGADFRTPPPPPPAEARAVATETHAVKAAEHARELAGPGVGTGDRAGSRRGRTEGRSERRDGSTSDRLEPTTGADASKPEVGKLDSPKSDAGRETPKPEVGKLDSPKPDVGKLDPPKPDVPKPEVPKVRPGKDLPKLDKKK